MLEGYKLELEITFCWKCKECGNRQEPKENEEWPYCCGKPMTYQPMRQFKPVKE